MTDRSQTAQTRVFDEEAKCCPDKAKIREYERSYNKYIGLSDVALDMLKSEMDRSRNGFFKRNWGGTGRILLEKSGWICQEI